MKNSVKKLLSVMAIGLFFTFAACEKQLITPNYNKEVDPPPSEQQGNGSNGGK